MDLDVLPRKRRGHGQLLRAFGRPADVEWSERSNTKDHAIALKKISVWEMAPGIDAAALRSTNAKRPLTRSRRLAQ